jgi:methionyl-tRNA formyltransferase
MRVVLLTQNSPNQRALANRLAKACDLVAVVLSRNIPRKPTMSTAQRLRRSVGQRILAPGLIQADREMMSEYARRYRVFPDVERLQVSNVNDEATLQLIERLHPELVAVSGTNMVANRTIGAALRHGKIVNLHTGISPYVKGGPNCTNWCLAKGWFHLIGNTVMWLDRGVDTGNLIATERTELTGGETLSGLHLAVMDHAHDVYLRCVALIGTGATVPSVPQSLLGDGVTFRNADWTGIEARRAWRNFRSRYAAALEPRDHGDERVADVALVDLGRSADSPGTRGEL